MNGNLIYELINPNIKIADLGCGKLPQYFYNDSLNIDSYDLYQDNVGFKNFKKEDILRLHEYPELKGLYNLIVVNHVFEHVGNLVDLFKTIKHIIKPHGLVYCSIPDGYNFTDIFYRLIHKFNSGGHINKFSRIGFTNLMADNGFKEIKWSNWEDDFSWFDKCFDLKYNQCSITEEEKHFLVNALKTYITSKNGFYYGWEFIFQEGL